MPKFLVISDMDYYPSIDGVREAPSAGELLSELRGGYGAYSHGKERVYVVPVQHVSTHDDGAYPNRLTEAYHA